MLLGLGAFCEHAFADHSVLHFASAEQSANFVVTPLGGLLQRTSAELDANFTQTTENQRTMRLIQRLHQLEQKHTQRLHQLEQKHTQK